MAHYKAQEQIVSEPRSINQRYDRAKVGPIERHYIQSADAQHRSQGKGVERYANVIGEDLTRSDLARFVSRFPPMPASLDVFRSPNRVDAGEFREIRIVARAKEGDSTEQKKDAGGCGGITPGASKGLRKIPGYKVTDPSAALRVSPVNTAMSANYQAI